MEWVDREMDKWMGRYIQLEKYRQTDGWNIDLKTDRGKCWKTEKH